MSPARSLPNRIRRLLEAMPFPELAEKLRVSRATLYRWMSDEAPVRRGPSAAMLRALSDLEARGPVSRAAEPRATYRPRKRAAR